jgi:Pvc16 N-terminal domain
LFDELNKTLSELLRRKLPAELVEQVSISFATPGADFPPTWVTLPAINLFLYEVQENRELRTTEPRLERQADGTVMRTPPPLRADCHYLITAWAKSGIQYPEQDEHRMLGEVLRVLHRYREIPPEALQGSLKNQSFPVRAAVLQPAQQQPRGDFWQALGGKPRAAFHYTVTIGIDTREPENVGHVVQVARS